MARTTLKIRFSMITTACLALIATVGGNPPDWWSEGDPPVITPSALQNNHGPSNIGQAKWMAKSALEALRNLSPSIAASVENDLVGPNRPIPSWNPPANEEERTNQHAPLLIGQLKAIATPFYDALHTAEPEWLETQLTGNLTKDTQDASNFYPWTASTSDDQNKAPATIGQLKAVFSLRVEGLRDSDGDGISDWKEIVMETDPQDPDTDEDGLTDSEEIEIGTDPKDPDSDDDNKIDGIDADPKETLVDWEKTIEAAYILIDVDGPPGEVARDLNDKGEVLFDRGIWTEGNYLALPVPDSMSGSFPNGEELQTYEVDPIGFLGLSSDYKLIGFSHVRYTSGQAAGGDGTDTAWAKIPNQSATHLADDIPFNFYNVLSLQPLGIDDTGRTFIRNGYAFFIPPSIEWHEKRRIVVSGRAGGAAPVFLAPTSGFFVDGQSWQFHADVSSSGYLVTNTSSDIEDSPNTTHRLAMWDTSLDELTLPASSEGWFYPVHVNDLPNGKPALAATKAGSGGDCVFLKNPTGQMEKCESLSGKKVRIFAGDGTAMTADHQLWRNGKLIPMRELCDRFGELLDDEWILQPFKSNKHGVYLIQALGPNGEQGNKIAVPVEVRDEQFATGVDDVSRQAKEKSADPGYEKDFWVMAPSGGNRTNETRMLISHESASNLKITPVATDASVTTPNPFPLAVAIPKNVATWPIVSWHGISATTKEASIDWQIGSPSHWQSATLPVKVKVMKGRTVKVTVWLVPCKTPNGDQSDPGFKPTKDQLDQYLNSVFKPQINVSFDCLVTETGVLDFDVEDGTGFGAPASTIKPHDGFLNTNNRGVGEFKTLRDHFEDETDINIYIIGKYISYIKTSSWITSTSPNFLATAKELAIGLTLLGGRSIVVLSNPTTTSGDWESMKDTIAHEIGHVIIGPGHPDDVEIKPDKPIIWDDAGVAPLLGVDPTNRLMCGGLKRRDEGATLIVKKEWDEAEKWLNEIPDVRFRKENGLAVDAPTGNY